MSRFAIGLDLGQVKDYTALAVVERVGGDADLYHLRHLERFRLGTSYPAVVERVRALLATEPLTGQTRLAVDATGVGMPVVDLLRQAVSGPIDAILITGGDTVTQEGATTRVPKRDLVGLLQVLLQSGRLKVARDLPEAATLVRELLSFQVKITDKAHDTYGAWREGAHDDLVLAVALACWVAQRSRPAISLGSELLSSPPSPSPPFAGGPRRHRWMGGT